MKVTILICTYGSEEWEKRGEQAYQDTLSQGAFATVAVHDTGASLAQVRNGAGYGAVGSDWLCFLDADDRLAPGYLETMRREWLLLAHGDGPAHPGFPLPPLLLVSALKLGDAAPAIPAWQSSIIDTNCAVIGTLVPRSLFVEVGGFREFEVYEDWELWLRCIRAGAMLVPVPDAVYLAKQRTDGRNVRSPEESARVYQQVRDENADVPASRWADAKVKT